MTSPREAQRPEVLFVCMQIDELVRQLVPEPA